MSGNTTKRTEGDYIFLEYSGFFKIQPDDKKGYNGVDLLDADNVGYEQAKANAAFIVKAANNHEELLAALKYWQEGIKHFYKCINFKDSAFDAEAIEFMNQSEIKIRKAIAQAEK